MAREKELLATAREKELLKKLQVVREKELLAAVREKELLAAVCVCVLALNYPVIFKKQLTFTSAAFYVESRL